MSKLSKSELGPLARETIDLLKSGGNDLLARAEAIAGHAPSNQIEYLDAVRIKARELNAKSDPENISALFNYLIEKVEFNPKSTHKLLKSMFDCAAVLAAERSDTACMDIYISFARAFESRSHNSKNPVSLDFRGLSDIAGFAIGFDRALISDVHKEEVLKAKSLWMNFLPEMCARDSMPLCKESMLLLIETIDSVPHEFPASVRLCRHPLSISSGKVQGDAAGSGVTDGGIDKSNSNSRTKKSNSPGVLPEIASLVDGVSALAAALSKSFETRLSAQLKVIEKLENDCADFRNHIDELSDTAYRLKQSKEALSQDLQARQGELEKCMADLEKSGHELGNFRTRHDVIIQGSEDKVKEAELRTKRQFVDTQLRVLVTIRDCLSKMVVHEPIEKNALQAALNFNNFLRSLRHDNYITTDQIQPIQMP
jgi:hypothetical protein